MSAYGIVSDLHFHGWSAFSGTGSDGLNHRLSLLLQELHRAAKNVKAAGGRTLIVAGDVFHVRGQIAPSVLNPVRDTFHEIAGDGMSIFILAGNHDLEGRHSSRLGAAVTALELNGVATGITTIAEQTGIAYAGDSDPTRVTMIPWIENVEDLKAEILKYEGTIGDLVIHAPINGVIKGIPDCGLDPGWLQARRFRNIFAGHYHHHKNFGNGVYSIGAIAHHTWSDVGSKAGHLIVADNGEVTFHASHCPEFVELDSSMSETDMALAADGNYVRVRVATNDLAEIQGIREALIEAGARGVSIIPEPPKTTVSRTATSIKKGMTLEESVARFIDPTGTDATQAPLTNFCLDVLREAQAV
jgi:DNA repair exonuclease SbcCD nuclease subunit